MPAPTRLAGLVLATRKTNYLNFKCSSADVPRSELFGAVASTFAETILVHEPNGLERFPAEKRGVGTNA